MDTIGDTITVTTTVPVRAGWPPLETIDSIAVLWRSDSLDRPSAIVSGSDGRRYVADGRHIFLLSPDGRFMKTLGRGGQGPGEFQAITGLGLLSGDTLLVLDGRQLRLTWFAPDGRAARVRTVTGRPPYGESRPIDLRPGAEGVVLVWGLDLVRPGGPPDTIALALLRWASDTPRVIAGVEDKSWTLGGPARMLGPRNPFGARALYAVSPSGLIAYGSGVDYCITLRRIGHAQVRRVCRRWIRLPVGAAAHPPADTTGIGQSGPALADLIAQQDPRLQPAHYQWEVFDGDGKLARRVALPSRFRPLEFLQGRALGLLEDEDGTLSIAQVTLPGGPGTRRP